MAGMVSSLFSTEFRQSGAVACPFSFTLGLSTVLSDRALPLPSRIRHLARLFLPLFSLQAVTQALTALAGLVVVRRLPIPDFAVYAVAVSVQASLTILSDVGISSLLLARAGMFHSDASRVAELANTARGFRTRLLLLMLVLAGPLLWWSLKASHPSFSDWALVLVLVGVTVACQASASLDGTIALSLLKPETQQFGLLFSSATRLGAFVVVLTAWPTFRVALLLNLLGSVIQASYLRRAVRKLLPDVQTHNQDDHLAFLRVVKSQALNATYFAFSSQITLWLVGMLSTARVVAEVGALGRLSSIIVLAQSTVMSVVAPRFARYIDPRMLLRRYLQVVSLALFSSLVLLALSAISPGLLLSVIGSKYAGLGPALTIAMASTLTYTLLITMYGLHAARAWIEEAWIGIPFTIGLQAVCLLTLDVSQLHNALLFGWAGSVPSLVVQIFVAFRRFRLEYAKHRIRIEAA